MAETFRLRIDLKKIPDSMHGTGISTYMNGGCLW